MSRVWFEGCRVAEAPPGTVSRGQGVGGDPLPCRFLSDSLFGVRNPLPGGSPQLTSSHVSASVLTLMCTPDPPLAPSQGWLALGGMDKHVWGFVGTLGGEETPARAVLCGNSWSVLCISRVQARCSWYRVRVFYSRLLPAAELGVKGSWAGPGLTFPRCHLWKMGVFLSYSKHTC